MAEKEEKASYVRMDNANLVKITFSKLAKDFATYSQMMIDIKKLSDKKQIKRKEFILKLKDLETKFKELELNLPTIKPPEKVIKDIERYKPSSGPKDVESELGTFAVLRDEFERLRDQLEDIKKTI